METTKTWKGEYGRNLLMNGLYTPAEFVVADQIPSKLSPDVLNNTNLKILHRLFAPRMTANWLATRSGWRRSRESRPATEQILRESGIQGVIDTALLVRQQRQQLAHAIMLGALRENLAVLERYFGVESLFVGN